MARNISLLSETWLSPDRDFDLGRQPFGFALRFHGGRLSADVGFVMVPDDLDEGFPVPWLSFTYHFGPKHRAQVGRNDPGTTSPAMARAMTMR